MTLSEQLRVEAAQTETVLREAAIRLLGWADLLAASGADLPAEEVRQLAHALARQGGRLSMARELAGKPRRK